MAEQSGKPLTAQFLRSSVIQELFSRVEGSKIPSHPFKSGDDKVIEEAMEALYAYHQLLDAAQTSDAACVKAVLSSFPEAWRWVVFLLPGAGNVRDLSVMEDSGRSTSEVENGQLAMGTFWRCFVFSSLLASFMNSDHGRQKCLAEPDFIRVSLVLITSSRASFMTNASDGPHRLVQHVYELLQHDQHGARAAAEIEAHDGRLPGVLPGVLTENLAEMFNGPNPSLHRFVPMYLDFSKVLLAPTSARSRFRDHGAGVQYVTNLLLRAMSEPDNMDSATRHPLVLFWMSYLCPLAKSGSTEQPIVDALLAGILPVFCFISDATKSSLFDLFQQSEKKTQYLEYRAIASEFIRTAMLPALLWPRTLSFFIRMLKKLEDEERDVGDAARAWPEFAALLRRYEKCNEIRKRAYAQLEALKYCHNPQVRGRQLCARHACANMSLVHQ